MPTILTWRLGALGDTLLLLPALAALRAAFPAHTLVAAGAPSALATARWQGLADAVLDASAPTLAPLLAGGPPATGALPEDIELAVIWSGRGADIARGLRQAGVPRVLTAPAIPLAPLDNLPVAERYLATLAPLGVAPVPFALHAPAHAHTATAGAWRGAAWQAPCGANAGPVALLHPGAGAPAKRWPLAHYRELAQRLRDDGAAVVWTAGPADEEIRARLEDSAEKVHVLPSCDVAGLAAFVERAAVVVSGDCGVAHLTALLGIRGVALFGPTSARLWGPPSDRTTVAHLALPCAPCGPIAPSCPSRMCLRGLSVDAVHRAVRLGIEGWRSARGARGAGDVARATDGLNHRAPYPSPSRPIDYHPPRPAPGPPGALRVAVWGNPDRWVRPRSTEPG